MKPNINILDGILRLFIGMVIGGVCAVMGWWIGLVTVYFIVTSLIAWDPIYYKMGKYTTEVSPYEEGEIQAATPRTMAAAPRMYKNIA